MKRAFLTAIAGLLLVSGIAYAQSYVLNPFTSELDAIGTLSQTGTFLTNPIEVREDGSTLGLAGTLDFQDHITISLTGSLGEIDIDDDFVLNTGDTLNGNFNVTGKQFIGGVSTPGASTILELSANDQALVLTRLADPDGDIASPVNGMIAYDSTDAEIQAYIDGGWVNLLSVGGVSDIWMNETGDTATGTHDYSAATILLPANAVDAITEISSSIRSGTDGTLITGTATTGECAEFDANGDIIGAGAACGTGSGSVGTSLNDVEFLVLTLTGTLNAERQFLAGTGLTGVDGGAGSGYTVNVDDDYVFNNGDTMTGALTFSGVASDITTATDEDLTLAPNGTGNVVISGSLTIGQDCSVYGNDGKLTTDNTGKVICDDDISGSLTFSAGGGVYYFLPETMTTYGTIALTPTFGITEPAAISSESGELGFQVNAFTDGDTGDDSGLAREFNMPDDYVGTPQILIHYFRESGTTGSIVWEAGMICAGDGDNIREIYTQITAPDTVTVTAPTNINDLDVATINLTDPGAQAGDICWVIISTDADNASDTATGMRYMKQAVFRYANE